ncbi:MAG: Tim44/TimA family putative adaptor protein [Alphaproteobacteria bacterium]
MGEGFQALDIILFAMIAAFIVLRLRGVLGRRTGNERQRPDPLTHKSRDRADSQHDDNVIELPGKSAEQPDEDFEAAESVTSEEEAESDDPVAAGLTQIRIADNSFDPEEFIGGARAAFEMIVQAFAAGDVKTLRNMLNDEVYDRFSGAVTEREKTEDVLETTLIGIKNANIIEARVDGRTAFVTVKFASEQVNVTRDKDGAVVDGDPNHIAQVVDIWTFAHNTRARDPNWTLVETRSSN